MEILVDRLPQTTVQPAHRDEEREPELHRGDVVVLLVAIAAVLATACWLALLLIPPFGVVISGGAMFIAIATWCEYETRDYWRDERDADWPLSLRADFADDDASTCACGKPLSHVDADPDSAEWACRVPDPESMLRGWPRWSTGYIFLPEVQR